MTKKTNSLLLRLGITSFWENKSPDTFKFIETFRLKKILQNELKKRKLKTLSIK